MSERIAAKFVTEEGVRAVRRGVKPGMYDDVPVERKPDWLRVRVQSDPRYLRTAERVTKKGLNTVCAEAMCPNISECWSHGTATMMLLGDVCTRACRFCSVHTGNPNGLLDPDEPNKVAQAVAEMELQYVVLTSVDRDDLEDGGAAQFAAVVREVHRQSPQTNVEVLVPDFRGCKVPAKECIEIILDAGVVVYAQNLETVRRLTHPVRDARASYEGTLEVLHLAHRMARERGLSTLTKTSLMVGLGETDAEVEECMRDARDNNVDIFTLGQYMRPTRRHLPVQRWVEPAIFHAWREKGLEMGFREVASGPLVRSSYRADKVFTGSGATT